jgi:hypothetical protein
MKYRKPIQLALPLEYPLPPHDPPDHAFEAVRREMRLAGFIKPRDNCPMIGLAGQYVPPLRPRRKADEVTRNFNRNFRKG